MAQATQPASFRCVQVEVVRELLLAVNVLPVQGIPIRTLHLHVHGVAYCVPAFNHERRAPPVVSHFCGGDERLLDSSSFRPHCKFIRSFSHKGIWEGLLVKLDPGHLVDVSVPVQVPDLHRLLVADFDEPPQLLRDLDPSVFSVLWSSELNQYPRAQHSCSKQLNN